MFSQQKPASLFLVLASWLAPALSAAPSDGCAEAPPGPERAACLLATTGDPSERIAAVEERIDHDPATAIALLDAMEPQVADLPAADRAWLFELRARGLETLSRPSEAADAWSAAVALDDGTERLTWLVPRTWTTALDTGDGRLERAAAALGRVGRVAEARSLSARATALGAELAEPAEGGPGTAAPAWPVLEAPAWRDLVPTISLPMYGGRSYDLAGARGKVVVLDFWATWCPPCVAELPFLDGLYAAKRERGLEVVAINYQEAPDEAMAFAQAMGLSLPIAMATLEVERHFKIRAMPTVIVVDREGGIRARWSGYETDLGHDIAELVEVLLAEERSPSLPVGAVLAGEGLLRVEWIREAREPIQGIGVVAAGDAGLSVAVALDHSVDLFAGTGHLGERLAMPTGLGKLKALDVDGDGNVEIFTFRPGGTGVASVRADGQGVVAWDAPAPVFDLLPLGADSGVGGALLLATAAGLWRADREGQALARIDGVDGASALASCAGRPWLLDMSGPLLRLDVQGIIVAAGKAPPGAWTVICDPAGGQGVAGFGVTSAVTGRFLEGSSRQAALGLGSGQLVLVDLSSGEVRFRARIDDGVTDLAAGDVDGDGHDELFLAAGKRFALLRCAMCGASTAQGSD